MKTELKKPRKYWLTDSEQKELDLKAKEYYNGKGYLSQFLRKIALSKSILIIEGKAELILKTN